MNDSVPKRLTLPLLPSGTRFFLSHRDAAGIPVQEMFAFQAFHPELNLEYALAVTPTGIIYTNYPGESGWYHVEIKSLTSVQEPGYLHPGLACADDTGCNLQEARLLLSAQRTSLWPSMESVSGATRQGAVQSNTMADVQEEHTREDTYGDSPFMEFETLPQYGYQHHPGAQAPEMKLDVPYHYVPLLSALYGDRISSPNDPAFAMHAPIGEKIRVALGIKDTQPPRTLKDIFCSGKQHRVRSERNRQPINRMQLAKHIATDVDEYMQRNTVQHKGKDITFDQLYLKKACLMSKGTFQPVLCVGPSAARTSVTLRSAQ